MELSERVAYLRGLAEGMKLDTETNEGKLISVIIDILEDVALEIADINENALDIGEELDALSSDLADVEEYLCELEEDDDCDCDCCCGDDDCDCDCCCDDDDCDCCCGDDDCDCDDDCCFYEVKCPQCGDELALDEEVLELGAIDCPNCGATLEFEFDEDDEEEDEE
ncbi:MAG: hypothetical protein J6S18_01425 [Oscillospiraceae bacterium]|nr:hypothetical protein [Oscillospiraceae bacterium]